MSENNSIKKITVPSIINMKKNNQKIWWGGQTHTHPDDTYGGKSHVETKWGTHFINAACLSRYHGRTNVPKSRLLTFCEGSGQVRVRCYMHTSEFIREGWYEGALRVLQLSRPFVP